MITWQVVAVVMRWIGLICVFPGLFFLAGGVRTIVSGRIDERQRSKSTLRTGIPLLVIGLLLLFGSSWLGNWAIR